MKKLEKEIEFPALVYKDKGPHPRKGGTYDYMIVESKEDFDLAIKNAWFETLPQAIEVK